MVKTKNNRVMLFSQCFNCKNKKSRFISEKEGSGILSSLGMRTSLSKIPGLNIYFKVIKMNNKVNVLLAGDKFMPEVHLRQPGVIYSACGLFTKNRLQK